jgi:hypothetical protein
MPQRCSICSHPEQVTIDQALDDTVPYREVAARYAVSKTSLLRHQAHRSPEADHEADQAHAPQSPAGTRLDLDAVNDAMWTLMDAYSHPADTVPALRQQVWALARVVHEIVLVLNDSSHSP